MTTRNIADLTEALRAEADDIGDPAVVIPRLRDAEVRPTQLTANPPSHPRRRAILAIAASVAAVLAVVGVVVAERQTPSHRPGPTLTHVGAVPWDGRDQRQITAPPTFPYYPDASGAPSCTVDDLELVTSSTSSQRTSPTKYLTTYELRSRASHSCALNPPGMKFLDNRGHILPLSYYPPAGLGSRVGGSSRLVHPSDLVVGATSWSTYAAAGDQIQPTAMVIYLQQRPTNHALDVPLKNVHAQPNTGAPPIDGQTRTSGVNWSAQDPSVGAPGSLGLLDAVVRGPGSTARGSVLHYSVRLTNRSAKSVDFHPCAQVRQSISIGVREVVSKRDGRSRTNGTLGPVNCDKAGPVDPGKSITFDFELPTGRLPSGSGSLTWQLIVQGQVVVVSQRLFHVTP